MKAIREIDLAERLGVPRESLRKLRLDTERGFVEGTHWDKLDDGITLSTAGIARMMDQPELEKISVLLSIQNVTSTFGCQGKCME